MKTTKSVTSGRPPADKMPIFGRPAPPNTQMFGPMIHGFAIVQWCPTPDGSGPPEAVALVFNLRELGDIVMRLKSKERVNEVIKALIEHRDSVWPEPENDGNNL